jgi:hypothetical protein
MGAARAGEERVYAFRLARTDLRPIVAGLKAHGLQVVDLVE